MFGEQEVYFMWGSGEHCLELRAEGVTLFELIMRTLNNTHPARLPGSLWTSLLPG